MTRADEFRDVAGKLIQKLIDDEPLSLMEKAFFEHALDRWFWNDFPDEGPTFNVSVWDSE